MRRSRCRCPKRRSASAADFLAAVLPRIRGATGESKAPSHFLSRIISGRGTPSRRARPTNPHLPAILVKVRKRRGRRLCFGDPVWLFRCDFSAKLGTAPRFFASHLGGSVAINSSMIPRQRYIKSISLTAEYLRLASRGMKCVR